MITFGRYEGWSIGEIARPLVVERPALLVADLDLGLTREESMSLDVAGHYSRPDVFAFEVNTRRSAM